MSSINSNDRSVADLVRELRDESTKLVREEIALAKTEMSEKASVFGRNAIALVAGGAIAFLGLIFLLRALSEGINLMLMAMGLPFHGDWLAPLIVGTVVCAIGIVMVMKAKSTLADASIVPDKSIQSLKEDKQWAKEKIQ